MKTFRFPYLLTITLLFFASSLLFAQGQGWQRVYPNFNNPSGLGAQNILPQPNGNYIMLITGTAIFSNTDDYTIAEFDGDGHLIRSKTLGTPQGDNARVLIENAAGNFVIAANTLNSTGNNNQVYFSILDNNFDLLASNIIANPNGSRRVRGLIEIPGGGYWMHGTGADWPNTSYLQKLDAQGMEIGDPIYDGFERFYGVKTFAASNGGVNVLGYGRLNNSSHSYTLINEYNSAGEFVNQLAFDHDNNELIPNDYTSTDDGGAIIVARNDANNPMLLKLDQTGVEEWRKEFDPPGFMNFLGIKPIGSQGYRIIFSEQYPTGLAHSGLIQTDLAGNWQWKRTYYDAFSNAPQDFIILPNGTSLISGRRNLKVNNYSTTGSGFVPYLILADEYGLTFGNGVFGHVDLDDDDDCLADNLDNIPGRIITAKQNDLIVNAGFVDSMGNYLILLDADNYDLDIVVPTPVWTECSPTQLITVTTNDTISALDIVVGYHPDPLDSIYGYVFQDHDEDCFRDSFETVGYDGWAVHLYLYGDTVTTELVDTTDLDGYYSFNDLSGFTNAAGILIYFEEPIGTGLNCEYPCWQEFELGQIAETVIQFDNGVQCDTLPLCPIMEVSIATNQIRPCQPGSYWVNYCNIGGVTAMDAYLEVTIDSSLTVTDASIPWTSQQDNIFTFDLGNLFSNQCENFLINFTAPCDDPTGTTYCSEVHAFPDSTCVPPGALWDGSEIELTAQCEGDSIKFTIENVGGGNMSTPLEYVIIEDNVLLFTQPVPFQLLSGETRIVTVPVEASFYRMEAMQPDGFPGLQTPVSWVEGCGSGMSNQGITNQYPLGDEDPWLDIFCMASVNSYDPNDKQGFPLGVSDENYIDQNQPLEYLIRFQNTGTAEALYIEVRDTIPLEWLDPTTVRPGASSHDYNWNMEGNGVVVFKFPNINLPDSTSNALESNGFVQFTVQQRPDNPINTEIKNTAAIYFDNNPPIITNESLHTIGEDYLIPVVTSLPGSPEHIDFVVVTPNPAKDFLQVRQLEYSVANEAINFIMYNSVGQLVMSKKLKIAPSELINISALPAGNYFYEISNLKGIPLKSYGKIIKF